MSAIYFFVFTVVFHRDVGFEPYIVFLISGLLPWMWLTGAVSDSARAFIKDAKLIRATKVHPSIWVARLSLAKGIEFLASIPVLVIFALFTGATVSWQIVFFPVAVVLQALLVFGIGLFLAPLVVFFRDLERATKLVLRVVFYCSPIVYDLTNLPERLRLIGAINPFAGILGLYRGGFFPQTLDWGAVGISTAMVFVVLGIGVLVFKKTVRSVLKEI